MRMPALSRRRRALLACVAVALAAGAGAFLLIPRVSLGRDWPSSERTSIDAIQHDAWGELLLRYVDDHGNVNYRSWKSSAADQEALNAYLQTLSRADPSRDCDSSARLAFWINAYNAVTIYGILREYPTSSIQNHTGWLGYNIWRDLRLTVGDRSYSLGQIEHEVLRPLGERRIHFAIVCASRGCPRLLNEPYIPDRLEEQLQGNSRAFFTDRTKCSWDAARKELTLSPILSWYATDFGRTPEELLSAIRRYLPDEEAESLPMGEIQIRYSDYDWSLNEQTTADILPAERDTDAPPLPPLEEL